MFSVSKLADYATVVMAYMALEFNKLHNARDIAAQTHIPLPTVSKILKLMTKAGLLISTRGVKGGYSLTRKPTEMGIIEVMQAVDGEFGITVCSHIGSDCQIEPFCAISCNWQLISRTMMNALETLTLADMVRPMQKSQMAVIQTIFIDAIKNRQATDYR